MTTPTITVYGADWCGDCRRAKQFLDQQHIAYHWVNTDENNEAEEFVKAKNNGKRIIPTIIFEDGSHLAEPSNAQLAEKLNISLQSA
jgi:glutaredoxin-like protein